MAIKLIYQMCFMCLQWKITYWAWDNYLKRIQDKNRGYLSIVNNKSKTIPKALLSKYRMFKVEIQHGRCQCLFTVSIDENWIWNFKYGHLNFRSLYSFYKDNMVIGLPLIKQQKKYVKLVS